MSNPGLWRAPVENAIGRLPGKLAATGLAQILEIEFRVLCTHMLDVGGR